MNGNHGKIHNWKTAKRGKAEVRQEQTEVIMFSCGQN
jgi:hypothetical protein